ncbi:AAHS family benzoate transporter-like MFS transporter [Nocardioides luteus]|uniref:MFS transporter n=1 Tax=Nocardioides luteus TaxID=1844 RepID=A0ABQ5SQA8_9ACTN|nr:MFS transporter [Nocardioides luteus]MDR7313053.1 AAHS family benzoate transporter-like MFS transporter [Nocardioides luteus]GGR44441.1 MFS transporter [Nocardioides luteus]GLJ66114.1 MFS transporter [Nocardioides luteus]
MQTSTTTTRAGLSVRRTPQAVLALSFAALTLEGYDLIVYGTVVPSLLSYQAWDLTPEQTGFFGSIAVLGMLLGALGSGVLTDRIGRRRAMVLSVTVFSVAMGLCAVATHPAQFGFFRLLVGLGAGGLMPTVVALVVEYSPNHRRSLNTAIAFAGVGIGGALAGLLAIVLVPAYGFRVMFAVGLVPLLVVLPLLLRHLPESVDYLRARGREEEARAVVTRHGLEVDLDIGLDARLEPTADVVAPGWGSQLRTIFGRRLLATTLLFWVATFLCLLVLFGANAWLPALMVRAGYGLESALSFLLVLNLGAVFGTLAASPLADRFGSKPIVAAAFTTAAVSLSLLAVHPPTAVVYVLVALAGVGTTGTQILVNTYVGSSYPTESRATALGLSLGVGRLGGVLGPTYGGYLLATGLPVSGQFYAYAVPALIGCVVILAIPRTRPDEATKEVGAHA